MLKVHYDGDVLPLVLDGDAWHITHKYNGRDTLSFEIDMSHEMYSKVSEETKVEALNLRFVVKKVSEHGDTTEFTAEIDLDDWRESVLTNARWTNALLVNVLNDIKPNGWSIVGAGTSSKRATVEYMTGQAWPVVSPLEVLDEASTVYGCVFNFDPINRIIVIVDPGSYVPSGQFFSDEVNLRSIGFDGDSSDFATRLYAYGKVDEETGKPLTFASVNGGKEYVEDHTYSDKVISVGWSDQRYTDPESLLANAKAKLKAMAYPVRSYACDVENLDDNVWMYKVVTLLDRKRKASINHQVVEYQEYPGASNLDVVTLSAVAPRLGNLFDRVQSEVTEQIDQSMMGIDQVIQKSVKDGTDAIVGNKGGSFKWIFDNQGRPTELVNLGDTLDIDTAKKVWRWNASGLGHSNNGYAGPFDLALLADGTINASRILTGILTATLIRAGILQSVDGETFYLDLENGVLKMKAESLSIGGQTVDQIAASKASAAQIAAQSYADSAAKKAVDAQTQESIFNKLTNNGKSEGIYLEDGKLYINASYVQSGTLSLGTLKLLGTICGLIQGYGALKSGKTTEGIVLFGNGVDTSGNAKPPYFIVTNAGIRGQAGTDYDFYMSGAYFEIDGQLIVNKVNDNWGNIYAKGDLVADGYMQYGDGYFESRGLWMGKNLPTSTAIFAYTDATHGVTIAGWSRVSNAVWVGEAAHPLVLHCSSLTSDKSMTVTSDRDAKKDIEPLEGTLSVPIAATSQPSINANRDRDVNLASRYMAVLDDLVPYRFRYKSESDNAPFHLGYTYQDLEAALDKAGMCHEDMAALSTSNDTDGKVIKGIVYEELIPLLHLKINDLQKQISALEKRLEEKL